jgi:hypothetical protein
MLRQPRTAPGSRASTSQSIWRHRPFRLRATCHHATRRKFLKGGSRRSLRAASRPSNGHRRPLLHPLGSGCSAARPASTISARQTKYDVAQHWFLYLFRRLRGREPPHNAFRFSGHCLFWRLTSNGKTRTSQTTTPPFFIRFSYENEPAARLATAPTTQPLRKLHAQPNTGATCPFSASPSE